MCVCVCVAQRGGGGLFREPPRAAAGVDGAEALSHWLFGGSYITFHCPFFLSRLLRALSVFLFCFVFASSLSPAGNRGVKTERRRAFAQSGAEGQRPADADNAQHPQSHAHGRPAAQAAGAVGGAGAGWGGGLSRL